MFYTERLIIRPFTLEDKEFLYELNNDKEVNRYRTRDSVSMDYCISSIKDWNNKYGNGLLNVYLMEAKETGEPIGLVALFKWDSESKAELGYRMLPRYWSKGYCTEAVQTLITKYFDEIEEDEIIAETHRDNVNSIRFLNHNKFIEKKHDLEDRGSIFMTHRSSWI